MLASGRYRPPDFGAVTSFRRLPDDAQWRLLRWFPSLRRLSEEGRAGLVERLAGHPRAVEFLDGLIAAAIAHWEDDHGRFEPGSLSDAEEQAQIIDAALPELTGKLSENLLFDALWDRVLDDASRDLLVRAGVLRRPGSRELLALAEGGGAAAIARLRAAGLLTEIHEAKPEGGWACSATRCTR